MVEISTVQKAYAAMQDSEIVALEKESASLTLDAQQVLKHEIKKRHLDILWENEQEEAIVTLKNQQAKTNLEQEPSNFLKEIWQYALDKKYEHTPDAGIIIGLMQKQLNWDEAEYVTQQLEYKATQLMKDAESARISAVARLFCGIAINIIAFVASLTHQLYFVGTLILAVSLFQMGKAASKKERFQQIIAHINEPSPPQYED